MMYTTLVFVFGVYVGQEYPFIPSVRVIALSALASVSNWSQQHERENAAENQNSMYGYIQQLFKKKWE